MSRKIEMRWPDEMVEAVDGAAEMAGMSRSEWVRAAVGSVLDAPLDPAPVEPAPSKTVKRAAPAAPAMAGGARCPKCTGTTMSHKGRRSCRNCDWSGAA